MKKKKINIKHKKMAKKVMPKKEHKRSFQDFLYEKKIFFETIVMLVLSIAGILISVTSVQVSHMANTISLNTQKIDDLEKQPYFTLEKTRIDNKTLYTIKNTGGKIHGGTVFMDKTFVVTVYDENYEYIGEVYVFLKNYLKNNFSAYDVEKQIFEIEEDRTNDVVSILELHDIIANTITEKGCFYNIEFTEFFDFTYIDYKQTKVNKYMIKQNGYISDIDNKNLYSYQTHIDIDDYSIESIEEKIIEQIDRMIELTQE